MGLMEVVVLLIVVLVVVLGAPFGVSLVLWAWGRRVARNRGGVWWPRAAWLPIVGLVCLGLGVLSMMLGIIHGMAAIADVAPESKSTLLAKGISEAVSTRAVFAMIAFMLDAISAILSLVGSLMKPAR